MKYLFGLICMLSAYTCIASEYDTALAKAREAAYIQTGAQDLVNKVTIYAQKELEKKHVPVTSLLYCYKTYTSKSLILRHKDKNLTLEPKSITASIKIHF